MEKLNFEGLTREEARSLVVKLPRNREFIAYILQDGRNITIHTNGRKTSRIGYVKNGRIIEENLKGIDITVHYDREVKSLNYIDDLIVDLIKKEIIIEKDSIIALLEAIKQSIELKPIKDILKEPEIKRINNMKLSGHSIEFILSIVRFLGLQEDVNYWGLNSKTNKPFEGRYKPYNALCDYFIRGMRLFDVIKKHRLVIVFMG